MSEENLKLAQEKLEKEFKKFKDEVLKLEPKQIYNAAGIITFTEATRFHLNQLITSEDLCRLVCNKDATIEGAVRFIINKIKVKYGQMGDLPVEEFQKLIWDYYKIDHTAAKKALEERVEKSRERLVALKAKNSSKNTKPDNQPNLMDLLTSKKGLNNNTPVNTADKNSVSQNSEIESNKTKNKSVTKTTALSEKISPDAGPLQVSLFDL